MEKNNKIIDGFKAVEFMRQERDQISNEIQEMNFVEIQKYFESRRRMASQCKKQETNGAITK
jgi:hypothetical protein